MVSKLLPSVAAGLTLWTLTQPGQADVLPLPEQIECERGQVTTTDHEGTRCVFKPCQSAADCPSGMDCVEREETGYDQRSEKHWTNRVRRCSQTGNPSGEEPMPPEHPGATPGGAKRSGCGCHAAGSDAGPAGLGLALISLLSTAWQHRRRTKAGLRAAQH